MNLIPLSVVVCTKNEEVNMDMCLGSVTGWVDEIVVVDDESQDATVELAKKYTDKIYFRKMDVEGTHRNWAYAQAKNEWVLSLDADEYVTEELKEEICQAIQSQDISCYSIPLRNFIGSYQVRYSGWYPAGKARLFRKNKFHYEEVKVHPRAFVEGKQGHLTKDIVHKGYPDFEHFISSLNRQTTLEAKKWIETGHKPEAGKIIWRTVDRFFRVYVRKKGYKDGFIGYMIALFASIYQTISYNKYLEFKRGNAAASHKDQPSPEIKPWDGPRPPLTVLVMTKNEEDNIADCLRSIHGWAGEIIVIDDESADRTREIATGYADKVVRERWINEGAHRNWCVKQAKYDWVMFLDADEMVTDELRRELEDEIQKGEYESFSLPLKTYIGKTWVRHSGWYPAHKLRVFDRRKQWFKEEKVHPTPANHVTCKRLTQDVFHKGYPDFEHFLSSVNRQSTAEAKKWVEEGRAMSFSKAFWRAADRFTRIYLRKKGYKDGYIGFMIAYLASLYQIMSYAKYWQIKREV
jgi:glycosyltransferase involved in cell wall biosynthesis